MPNEIIMRWNGQELNHAGDLTDEFHFLPGLSECWYKLLANFGSHKNDGLQVVENKGA